MTFTETIRQIRDLSREDISLIVSDYINLKPSGNSMKGYCPFHEEKTPSFHVSDQKGIYKCFGCGQGGDAIDFMMRIEGKEFHEVIYQLADRYQLTIEKNTNGSNRPSKPKPDPVPGLKEVRFEIRKAQKVTIICNDASFKEFGTRAIVRITPPLTGDQADSLKRYTDTCELVPNGLPWPVIQESIISALKSEFVVSVLHNGKSMDWIHYVMGEHTPERKEIVKLLAAIPDALTRSVYMTEYSKLAGRPCEVDECR
jgi:hypothetical protein